MRTFIAVEVDNEDPFAADDVNMDPSNEEHKPLPKRLEPAGHRVSVG